VKNLRSLLMLFVFLAVVGWSSSAYAQWLGTAVRWNTISHEGLYNFESGDVNNPNTQLFFLSDVVEYDNLAICVNKGKNITFVPGGGQSDPFRVLRPRTVQVAIDKNNCGQNGNPANACPGVAVYFTTFFEVDTRYSNPNNPDFAAVRAACNISQITGAPVKDQSYMCYQYLLGIPAIELDANLGCQNKSGRVTEVRSEGICAQLSSNRITQTQPNGEELDPGDVIRFTLPNFNPTPGQLYDAHTDGASVTACTACLDASDPDCVAARALGH